MGEKLVGFETTNSAVGYSSIDGFNDVKHPYAHGIENIYLLLLQRYIPSEEYKNSTQKDEYVYSYKKDDEIKGDDKDTVENEGIVEYGTESLKCKIIHERDSI